MASQRIECGDSLGARASSPRKWTRRGAPWERGLPARENIPAEEPKNVLDRVIDAFCTNRPLQSDEMAALAASGEVTQDEIYETGYRWHFAANAWVISPEAVGRKFVPSRRYRGLDGKWHDTRHDGEQRYAVASRVTPAEDAAYMDAVNRGDMETAGRMVREAAASRMVNPVLVYKGARGDRQILKSDKKRDALFFSSDFAVAETYVGDSFRHFPSNVVNIDAIDNEKELVRAIRNAGYGDELEYVDAVKIDNDQQWLPPTIAEEIRQGKWGADKDGRQQLVHSDTEQVIAFRGELGWQNIKKLLHRAAGQSFGAYYIDTDGFLVIDAKGRTWDDLSSVTNGRFNTTDDIQKEATKTGVGYVIKNIRDAIVGNGERSKGATDYIVPQSVPIKSAAPVTYDDAGNVIPLSQRFNTERDDIRYQVAAKVTPMTDDEVERAVEMFGTTDDPNESAYILPDGRWIDMENLGEHWEISQAFTAKHKKEADKASEDSEFYGDAEPYVASALGAGLVRTTGGVFKNGSLVETGIQFGRIPDAGMVGHVERFLDAVRAKNPGLERITVDGLGLDGRWSRQYGADEADAAIRDIRQYAATGTEPRESLVARFHGGRYAVSSRPSPETLDAFMGERGFQAAYHGTVGKWRKARFGKKHHGVEAFYLSAERGPAEGYAALRSLDTGEEQRPSVRKFYVKGDNVLRIEEANEGADEFAAALRKANEDGYAAVFVKGALDDQRFRLDKKGNIVYPDGEFEDAAPADIWVVFDPESLVDESEARRMFSLAQRGPSQQFAQDGTIADALPAHLREDARAIIAERANTPAWMADPDGTPTDLSERDWLKREAKQRKDARENPLVAVHGIKENQLLAAIDEGAFVMPSIGVSTPEIGNTESGLTSDTDDFTVFVAFDRDVIDSEKAAKMPTDGDVFTPVFADLNGDLTEENIRRTMEQYASEQLGIPLEELQKETLESLRKRVRESGPTEVKYVGRIPLDKATVFIRPDTLPETKKKIKAAGFKDVVESMTDIPSLARQAQREYAPRFQIASTAGAERLGIRNLADAEAMERSGATRLDIWRETGWWRGTDGKWRVEVPDAKISDKGKKKLLSGRETLGSELLPKSHPLLKAYPELASTVFVTRRNLGGGFSMGSLIGLDRDSIQSGQYNDILHEIQHRIQLIEGIDRGTNRELEKQRIADRRWKEADEKRESFEEALTIQVAETMSGRGIDDDDFGEKASEVILAAMGDLETAVQKGRKQNAGPIVRKALRDAGLDAKEARSAGAAIADSFDEWRNAWESANESVDDYVATRSYLLNPGEIEARVVEARMRLNEAERQEIPPWVTARVVRGDNLFARSDYSYAAQRSMMARMAADGTLENQPAQQTRYAVAPHGVQKQAGVDYPDAGEEIARFAVGAKRRAAYADVLARKRPDLDAGKVLAELDKLDDPKKEKLALHWIVRGTIRLPEDAYKVEDALEVANKAKVDPFQYGSPMELLEAHREFKPTPHGPIDPDTVPQLTGKTDMGHGVTVYMVQDDAEGQKAMREILNAAYGKEFSPWCLLHGDGKGGLSSQAAHWWGHYSSLPKKVAFKDGKPIAFMATSAKDEIGVDRREMIEQTFEDETDLDARKEPERFRQWMRVEGYYEEYTSASEGVPEEWWDLKDHSHEGIPATVKVDGDPLGRMHTVEIRQDGSVEKGLDVMERHSGGIDEEWDGYEYNRIEKTGAERIESKWWIGTPRVMVSVANENDDHEHAVVRSQTETASVKNDGGIDYWKRNDEKKDDSIQGLSRDGVLFFANGTLDGMFFEARLNRRTGGWMFRTNFDGKPADAAFRKAFDAWLARFTEMTTRPADSIGPEERKEGRSQVQGRVRAFDNEPHYSPRASLAAVATMELLAGREPDRDALEQMRTRLGLEADVDEVIGEAKAVLDSAVGEIARRGAGRNPGAVAVAIAESVQGNHPEDLVQEAFRAGANAQKWAQGTRGAALNALVRNTRGDNYADLVMETGVDATGVLQSFPDMVRRRRADRQEPAPAPAGERPDEATEAKPAHVGEPPSLADIGPIDPNSPEGRRIAALREQQEANIEKAIRETEKEMEQRRLDAWLEDAAKRQKAEADAKASDPDSDDDGGDADLDEGDESGVSDEIKIPVEVLERNLVDASDPETFTLWLRKVVRNRILKANGLSTDFPDLAAAQAAERDLWANPTNVAAFAKSMSAILRDMARRMLDHGSGAYTEVIRKAATLPHYDNVDAIEDEVAFEVRVMSGASISQTSAQLVSETRRKLKRDFIGATKPNEHPELQDDLVRKITGRVREMAKWYRNVLALTEGGVEKMRDTLEARLEERGRNLDEAGKTDRADKEADAVWDWTNWQLSVLDRFGGTRYLLPAEARERCAEIQTWMAKEGMAWAQKMEAMTAQYEADRKTIIDGCRIVDKDGRTVKHEKDTRFEGFWRYTVNTIDQRLRLLFARAGGDAGRAAKALRDRTSLRLAQGTTRYEREKQEMHRALVQTVRNVVGPRGVRAWIERMTQEIPEEQAVALSKQNNRHLTYGQVLHLYGYLRQTATYGDNIAKYGREEQRDYIERNVLTAEDVKILDGIMQIYADNRRALDEASRDITGFPIKNPDPFYLPVKIKQKARSGLETTVSTVQAMPAVFSERRRHGLDVDEKADIMAIFYDRMEQTARVLGFGRTGLDIIHTFGSADVKEAITEARGAKFTTALIAHFTDWMNGGRPRLVTKEGDDAAVLNSLRTAFVYTALWGNTLSAFKQTLSAPVFSLAREAGERGVFRDMMGVFSDGWKQAKAELTQSDPWKARYGDVGVMQETKEAVLGAGEGSLWQAILRAGMQPLQWGDATPGILCQVTAYKVERDRLIEEGTEPEEAKRIAADKAMQQVEWTQQSSRAENLPEYSRRGSSAMRMMMMFASSPMLQAGWEVQRFAEWREKREAFGPDAKETKDAAAALWNAVVVNHVVMPVLFQTATAIFNLALGKDPPDEKDAIELAFNMLIGPFARLVFFGGMANGVWNAAWSQGLYGRSDVVPSLLTNSEQNVKDVLINIPVDLFRGDMDEALADIDKFLKRNVAPYRHGRQAVENWTE